MGFSDEPVTTQTASFAKAVYQGLTNQPKELYSKFIYDDEGSRLFERIMNLPEYYPTQCEKAVFQNNKTTIAKWLEDGKSYNVVELGAGNGEKTSILLNHFLEQKKAFQFWPLDISELAISRLKTRFSQELPDLDFQGLVGDYFEGLEYLNYQSNIQNFVLFLGSNVGNFPPDFRDEFLHKLRSSLKTGDQVLIGIDLKKDPAIINKAYNDHEGVTEAFNFNLLHRINRELDGNFDTDKFQFYAAYNAFQGGLHSSLVAKEPQSVYIGLLDETFEFDAWEAIHTESSYKYSFHEIKQIGDKAGFMEKEIFTDDSCYYANVLWEVV